MMSRAWPWVGLALSGAAVAADGEALSPMWLVGVLITVVGALIASYVRGLHGRIDKVEAEAIAKSRENREDIGKLYSRYDAIHSTLRGDYHTKSEIKEAVTSGVAPILVELRSIQSRLDHMDVPPSHGRQK